MNSAKHMAASVHQRRLPSLSARRFVTRRSPRSSRIGRSAADRRLRWAAGSVAANAARPARRASSSRRSASRPASVQVRRFWRRSSGSSRRSSRSRETSASTARLAPGSDSPRRSASSLTVSSSCASATSALTCVSVRSSSSKTAYAPAPASPVLQDVAPEREQVGGELRGRRVVVRRDECVHARKYCRDASGRDVMPEESAQGQVLPVRHVGRVLAPVSSAHAVREDVAYAATELARAAPEDRPPQAHPALASPMLSTCPSRALHASARSCGAPSC